MKCTWFVVLCAIGIALCIEHDFKGFDDSILFGINWPGAPDILDNLADGEIKNTENNLDSVSTDCLQLLLNNFANN